MIRFSKFGLSLLFLVGVVVPARAAEKPIEARNGMVVSVCPIASQVGVDVMKQGGNAVDASVATAFALAVTYPIAGNIGGGGFMLVHPTKGEPTVFEYRETAPAAATADMFVKQTSTYRHNAVGVPGTVRGLALAHKRLGKLPWKDVVIPAVKLDRDGFVIDRTLASSLNGVVGSSDGFAELQRVLGKEGGHWKAGDRFVQADLAKTLQLIADGGGDAFYTGPIADQIVAEMKTGGGLITKADLAKYEAKERKPIHGTYRGYDIYGPPPPSSGGICVIQMLNVLENFDLKKEGRYSPKTVHLMAETMRRAFCERAQYLGDPDFTPIPDHLTAKSHAKLLAKTIDLSMATKSEALATNIPLTKESEDTTHFSVIDKDGMAVSNTYTLEHSYGSKVVVHGAGFLLNNEMSDFNWKPGITDRSGRIGTPPNNVAPGKRMISSQTPTIVAKGGKPVLVTGSPGSRTIINTVLCIVVNVIDYDMDVQTAVDSPRMHHGWFPDELHLEQATEQDELVAKLREMKHTIGFSRQGDGHSIGIDSKSGIYRAGVDRRIHGGAAGY